MAFQPPPLTGNAAFDRWLRLYVSGNTTTTTEAATTDHTALQNLNSANFTHLTASQASSLTNGADSVLHFHSEDRDRANHTGTQTADTISDFVQAVQAVQTNTNNGVLLAFAAAQG